MDLFFVLTGLAILLGAGEATLRGAIAMARLLRVSPAVIGLTVVGLGTSAPELVVSLRAALAGRTDFAVGNVVGSNISNILLILGTAAVICPLASDPRAVRRDGLAMLAAAVLCVALGLSGQVVAWQGLAMLLVLAMFMGWSYRRDQRERGPSARLHEREAEEISIPRLGPVWTAVYLVVGLAGLTGGAALLVDGAAALARAAGIPEYVIGLTLLALGTSLPELFASVTAARRRHSDVEVANILGSHIFNVLGILGVTALVSPLPIPAGIRAVDLWIMLAASLVILPVLVTGWRITRLEGALLLAGYAVYIGSLAIRVAT